MAITTPPKPPEPLTLTTPIVVNKSYDKYRILHIDINVAPDGSQAGAMISMIPYNSSTGELAPNSMMIQLSIPDIIQRIVAKDIQMTQIFNLILMYATKEAHAQGKL